MDEVSEKGNQFDTSQGDIDSGKLSEMSDNDVHYITAMSQQESPDSLQEWTKAMVMRNNLSRIVGKISITGHAPLQPSDFIQLEGIGKHFDGATLVSSVFHSISHGKWKTLLNIGFGNTLFANKYNDITDRPALGAVSGVNGLQVAKVEALEGDPLNEERIYIRLMNDPATKLWARIATLDAGNQRGSFFMPEINDEVVVGFIDGNPNQAVVLGMLHSSQAASPYPLADDNNIKGFVTREKITIELDDEKKALRIETPGGNKLLVSDDQKGISLEDQNGNTIVMNDQGVTIESKKALNLKAAQDVSIEGNNVNIKANAQLKATGNASAEISASGNTVVKGAMVQIN
jgi:Rhs element Vgr protein